MPDLSTTYMGLKLKNPIIVGASALTANMDMIQRLSDCGAAAIVTKSLFEEQVQLENLKFDENLEKGNYRNPEMITIRPHLEFGGPAEHLSWVRKAKCAAGVPVIASLNATNQNTWLEYARKLADTGVDALECCFVSSPADMNKTAAQIEDEQIEIVTQLHAELQIPLGVKVSSFYTHPVRMIQRMDQAGVSGIVLFNRLLEPDIDPDAGMITSPFNLSHETDYRTSLRYAGLLDGLIRADICCSTGIYDGETVAKTILAGAQAVQIVSTLFRNGPEHIQTMMRDLDQWMSTKGYATISAFRGNLSRRHVNDPWAYTRAQYVQLLMNPDEFAGKVTNL